jgi:disulfide bond formation protein DsbB
VTTAKTTNSTRAPEVARVLNFIGMLIFLGILFGAWQYQFSTRSLPCTLCLLQRIAFLGVAFGCGMNLMLGPKVRHYGVILVSATFGILVSLRQTFLHINPYFDVSNGTPTLDATTNPPFGPPSLGLALYVWGIIIFLCVFLGVGLILMWKQQFVPYEVEPKWLVRLAFYGVLFLALVAAAEVLFTFAECGPYACPDDGSWDWWLF